MKPIMKARSILTTIRAVALCLAISVSGAPAPEDMAKAEAGDAAAQEKVGDILYKENNYTEAIAWYTKAGEQGRGKSCYSLANMYNYSTGVSEDKDTAKKWYLKAFDAYMPLAEQGDAEAMASIASFYQYSLGVAEDKDIAKKWYLKALDAYMPKAEAGDADAMSKIASYYRSGLGVEKDAARMQEWSRKAFVIFKQKAEDGDTTVFGRISYAYFLGNGVEKDLAEAAKWFKRDAENGSASAMSRMGQMHIKGEGVPQDYAAAAEWLQKAVAKNESGAYYYLGTLYENGNGVPKDTGKAVSLYKAGAAKNDYYAKNRLNELNIVWDDAVRPEAMQGKDAETIYAKAQSITPTTSNAIKLYRMAAEAGHAKAQFELGQALDLGFGNTTKNEEEAAKWYRAAAGQGLAEAQYKIGKAYYYGTGVDKDPKEATRWFLKAAEQEHKEAFFNVGLAYEHGSGVAQDINEAIKWYTKSAEAGNPVSAKQATELKAKIQGAQNVAGDEEFQQADDLAKLDAYGKENLARAQKGEAAYQFTVARCYEYGEHGFPVNFEKAIYWHKKSASPKWPVAYDRLATLYKEAPPKFKSKGKQLYWLRLSAKHSTTPDEALKEIAALEAEGVTAIADFDDDD